MYQIREIKQLTITTVFKFYVYQPRHRFACISRCPQIRVASIYRSSFLSYVMVQPYNSPRLMWWFCGDGNLGSIPFTVLPLSEYYLFSIQASKKGTWGGQVSLQTRLGNYTLRFCSHLISQISFVWPLPDAVEDLNQGSHMLS